MSASAETLGQPGSWQRWRYAAKPASWPKLLVPAALGQALGVWATGQFDPLAAAFCLLFTVADLLFVVFLNDWGDEAVDRIKRQMFPAACSPKTIPDDILPRNAILGAGLAAGVAALSMAWAADAFLDRSASVPFALGAMAVFVAYTLPPFRLNYRGGGELLEMVGVGLLLPWYGFYLQSGELLGPQLWILPGFALLALASAVASGLSDEESDRRGGKATFCSVFGNMRARWVVEMLVLAGALVWMLVGSFGLAPPLGTLAALAIVFASWRGLREASPGAVTSAFDAQRTYKTWLHRAIWWSTLVLCAAILVGTASSLGSCLP